MSQLRQQALKNPKLLAFMKVKDVNTQDVKGWRPLCQAANNRNRFYQPMDKDKEDEKKQLGDAHSSTIHQITL